MSREQMLAETFVEMADTLVDDFDVIELLGSLVARCVRLFDAAACGVLLVDTDGRLRVVAASSEQVRLLQLFELQNEEGPSLEAVHTGRPVVGADLAAAMDRWPRFAVAAREAGYASAQVLPMRLRYQLIGALNLFHTDPRESSVEDVALAQAVADVATIAILQTRIRHPEAALAEQLREALNSRILVEQATGVVAERRGMDPAAAFDLLRGRARQRGLALTDFARSVIEGATQVPEQESPPRARAEQ